MKHLYHIGQNTKTTVSGLIPSVLDTLNLRDHVGAISKTSDEFIDRWVNVMELRNAATRYDADGPCMVTTTTTATTTTSAEKVTTTTTTTTTTNDEKIIQMELSSSNNKNNGDYDENEYNDSASFILNNNEADDADISTLGTFLDDVSLLTDPIYNFMENSDNNNELQQ